MPFTTTIPPSRRRHSRPRARAATLPAFVALVATFVVLTSSTAMAVHGLKFQLDGDITHTTYPGGGNTANQPYDWTSLFNAGTGGNIAQIGGGIPAGPAAAGFVASGAKADHALPDFTTYTQGSKDTLNISTGWTCTKSNNVNNKVDILNTYATAFRNPGDNHLILYFGTEIKAPEGNSNVAIWFLKDGTVDCDSAPSGATKNFTGDHQDGDILLVSAFTNGGTQANVAAYKWNGGANGSLGTTPVATGGLCPAPGVSHPTDQHACAIVNSGNVTPTWNSPVKGGGNTLAANQFFEGGVDITAALNTQNQPDLECFARFVGNTRSSQSLTATLFDFAAGSLPVCGELKVFKYVDDDADGTFDVGTENPGQNWSFAVKGPAATNAGPFTTTVCSGTTGADGYLTCGSGQSLSNLTPGFYEITETQKTGFYNTDPGGTLGPGDPNLNASVSKIVHVTIAGGEVPFGNRCLIEKKFTVTGAPNTLSAVFAFYYKNGSPTRTDVDLTYNTTTFKWEGTAAGKFVVGDSIDYGWGINKGTAEEQTVPDSSSLNSETFEAGDGCSLTNDQQFAASSVSGHKYKDVDADGVLDEPGDLPASGWQFELRQTDGTTVVKGPVSSNNVGKFTFTGVDPGTYRVYEISQTDWVQTAPTSPAYFTVEVELGDGEVSTDTSSNAIRFLNTPPARFDVRFFDLTGSTNATISCEDASQQAVPGTGTFDESATPERTFTSNKLLVGTYTCTVTIVDP